MRAHTNTHAYIYIYIYIEREREREEERRQTDDRKTEREWVREGSDRAKITKIKHDMWEFKKSIQWKRNEKNEWVLIYNHFFSTSCSLMSFLIKKSTILRLEAWVKNIR